MKEIISIIKRQEDEIIGSGYADSDGKEFTADIDKESDVKHRFVGQPQKSRETELNVALILVKKINDPVEKYDLPEQNEQTDSIVDCIARSKPDNNAPDLEIQIVNSNNDNFYWSNIARNGFNSSVTPIEELCNQVINAITCKSNHYGKSNVNNITLALDATANPQHALFKTIHLLKNKYQNQYLTSGFKNIWIVGPNVSMTYCIFSDDDIQ